jgi:hypothetical protein
MQRLLKKGVMTILGLALVLGGWTIRDKFFGRASAESYSHIPARVWSGGGGQITIEAEASDPGKISASFETNLPIEDPNHRFLETWQKIDAGKHTFTVEVPPGVGGMVELDIDQPKVGAKARIAVLVDGRVAAEDTQILDAPLKPGWGFAAQVEMEDYATGKLGED